MLLDDDEQEFPVGASADLLDTGTRVLKHGETFLVCERHGDVLGRLHGQLGLYHHGMRHLSRLRLRIAGQRLLLLGSSVRADNVVLVVELMNPDLEVPNERSIDHGTIHVRRERLLWEGTLYEEIRFTSYADRPLRIDASVLVDADFVDLFEVRGTPREARGICAPPELRGRTLRLAYEGLDREVRETIVEVDRLPEPNGRALRFRVELPPHGTDLMRISVRCTRSSEREGPILSYNEAHSAAISELTAHVEDDCHIDTSNALFDAWVHRSLSDLRMMVTETRFGRYPYAGVPWYSTPFGRDGIITALEALWVNPTLAAGVLEYLAARQATILDEASDAEPGKVLHETRSGEMAALGEVPFGCYYGSVDATPLFVVLAGRYHRVSGDTDHIHRLWPAIENAIAWMDEYGDIDGDGFVEYARRTPKGLVHQGWKDSQDSVFHADGSDAEAPIALCEVQGYVYAARLEAARLAEILGEPERAQTLRHQAAILRAAFEEHFWCEKLSTYALALDGENRPCEVRASNAGHCLFAGIASPERAKRVAGTLLDPSLFCGWGVRTIAEGEARFNPMSYHNGSVWPHDNAMIAEGLARYGSKDAALAILDGLFAVSCHVELHRLPELFCGFARRGDGGPTLYPVACSPQAWAAGAVLMLLSAVLGIEIDAAERRLTLVRPVLPQWLDCVRLRSVRVGEDRVDLTLRRYPGDVALTVERRTGPVEVIVVK